MIHRPSIAVCLAAAALAFALGMAAPASAAGWRGDVAVGANGSYYGANPNGAVAFALGFQTDLNWTEGTGANQADKVFSDNRTLSASSSENLDLAGVLTDPFGATLTFVTVKAIIIQANAANTNDVVVGGAATNAFVGPFGGTTPTVAVRPGGMLVLAAPATGWTVTPSTGDLLKVLNGGAGTAVTYKVIIIGTSA